jgi:hypothetical protein
MTILVLLLVLAVLIAVVLFPPQLTKKQIDEMFPCPYCGGPRHDTFKEGVDCAMEFIQNENE